MTGNRFTLEPVEWAAWMPVVSAESATPRQAAALAASPQRDSPYFQTLAHDVDSLEQRSPLFHAVMYVPRGLPRADRELATVVVSIINGCVYCSSVHARRFAELTKRPEVIQRLYDEGLGTALEPECKMYRLAADIFNDAAMILDCLSPAFPVLLLSILYTRLLVQQKIISFADILG